METLLMSGKERKRMVLLAGIKKGELSVAEAGRAMGVCYRQAKRIWHRYQKKGDAGLVHRNRGQPGARRKGAKFRRQVLARYQQRYPDFGPTLAAEKLQEEGLQMDHETLRRWLIEKGLWKIGRKRRQHRAWRERKECFGQMVQLDGSHHDWFEGRREKAVLMVMIDDATNRDGGPVF
jgi:molybdenum-dependent DNA-binding transcriptional regulator ModE